MAKGNGMRAIGLAAAAALCMALLAGCSGKQEGTAGAAVVDSVEQLRAVSSADAQRVITTGYYEPGDQGGGVYYLDSGDAESEDNGGTVIVAQDGARWKLSYSGPVPLRQFGARGDGETDDTQSIKNWLASLGEGMSGYAGAGRYLFSEPLTGPLENGISLLGDGGRQTVFVYDGKVAENEDATTVDLVTLGSHDKVLTGWLLQGIGIDSNKRMEAGSALRICNMRSGTRLKDVIVGTLGTAVLNKTLYDGVRFDNCNVLNYDGFEIDVQHTGIIVNGAQDTDSGSDVTLDNGMISYPTVGIHAGGGFGGLYVGQVLVYGAMEYGFLQDNSVAARGNREIILSEFCVLDAARKACVYVNDPLSNSATLQIDAFISGAGWLEPKTAADGISIIRLPYGRVSIGSTQVRVSGRHGLYVRERQAVIRVSPNTFITDSAEYGIYLDGCPAENVYYEDAALLYNQKGDIYVAS